MSLMMMGAGPAIPGGSTPWSPEEMSGYVDSPYSIAHLRSIGALFQDLNEEIPAVDDLDPVRVIVCGSRRYTAPSDAARVLLWDEGDGEWSLSFDGADDTFEDFNTGSPAGLFSWHLMRSSLQGYFALYENASSEVAVRIDSDGRVEPDFDIWYSGSSPYVTDGEPYTIFVWRSDTDPTTMWVNNELLIGDTVAKTIPATLSLFPTDSDVAPFPGRISSFGFATAKPDTATLAKLQSYITGA